MVELIIEKVKNLVREITLVGLSVMLKLRRQTIRFVNGVVLENWIALPYNRLWLLLRTIGNGRLRCRYNRLFGGSADLLRIVLMQFLPCLFDMGCWKIQCKLPPKTKRFCPLVLK